MTEREQLQAIVPGLMNAGCPLPGVATAGQPTMEEFESLAKAGYRTVLDLRAPDEPRGFDEPAIVRATGMEYVNIPVTPATLGDDEFDRFRDLMNDEERRPVVIHCGTANRVGALLIPWLVLDQGRDPDDALQTAIEVGLRSQELADIARDYIARKRG